MWKEIFAEADLFEGNLFQVSIIVVLRLHVQLFCSEDHVFYHRVLFIYFAPRMIFSFSIAWRRRAHFIFCS